MALDDDDDFRSGSDQDSSWDEDDRHGPAAHDIPPDDRNMARCTSCRKLIFDDTPRCPYCGDYQIEENPHRKPLWFWVTVILCIGLFGGFGILAAVLGLLHAR